MRLSFCALVLTLLAVLGLSCPGPENAIIGLGPLIGGLLLVPAALTALVGLVRALVCPGPERRPAALTAASALLLASVPFWPMIGRWALNVGGGR